MRSLLCGLLITVVAIPALAGFESQEEVSKWVTFYYQTPEPSRLPEAVEYMSQSGMLDNKNAIPPIFGFISGVFKDNPESITGWMDRLSSLKEEHFGVVVLGLWYANLPESQSSVYTMLDKHPILNNEFGFLRKGTPMPVDKIPLEQGAWVLDALWGEFMATGRKESVERIINALPWSEAKGDINRLLVGGAAKWSLTSNSVQHERVLKFCVASLETQPSEVVVVLKEIVEAARKERKERDNKSLQPTSAPPHHLD